MVSVVSGRSYHAGDVQEQNATTLALVSGYFGFTFTQWEEVAPQRPSLFMTINAQPLQQPSADLHVVHIKKQNNKQVKFFIQRRFNSVCVTFIMTCLLLSAVQGDNLWCSAQHRAGAKNSQELVISCSTHHKN